MNIMNEKHSNFNLQPCMCVCIATASCEMIAQRSAPAAGAAQLRRRRKGAVPLLGNRRAQNSSIFLPVEQCVCGGVFECEYRFSDEELRDKVRLE